MHTGAVIGLAVIGTLIVVLLWQKLDQPPQQIVVKETPAPAPVIIDDRPVYNYPVTYTSSPWRVPAYSYGSIGAYQRYHHPISGPRYVPSQFARPWSRRSHMISQMRPMPPIPQQSSRVARIAMSHPIRAQNNVLQLKK